MGRKKAQKLTHHPYIPESTITFTSVFGFGCCDPVVVPAVVVAAVVVVSSAAAVSL